MVIKGFKRTSLHFGFILSVLFFNNLSSQESHSTILKHLFKIDNERISRITLVNEMPIDNYDSFSVKDINPKVELLHNKGVVFALIKGTGKLFQIDSSLKSKRIDKSIFGGSTFGSANFIYNDTIYSIGGYGFWDINGAIRFFNTKTAEWDIIRTNQDVRFANGINSNYFIDYNTGKFYLLYNNASPEYIVNEAISKNKCYVKILDLKTKKWDPNQYAISSTLAYSFSDLTFIQSIDEVIIANSKFRNNSLLINFTKNTINELNDAKITEWIQLKNNIKAGIIYNIKDTVYLVNEKDNDIVKYSLSKNDIKLTNEKLYEKIKKSYPFEWYVIIGLIAILILIIGNLIKYYNKYKLAIQLTRNDQVYTIEADKRTINEFVNNLSVTEREVLEMIVKNKWNGQTTSVNQINRILGTEKKNDKIQNNIRGELILELNNKFKIYSLLNDDLIERKKSSFDKRHIEYDISDKMIHKIPKKLFS
jgi:hypothetical protein